MEGQRLDLYLVTQGLAKSRTLAQEMIAGHQVFLRQGQHQKALTKASFLVTPDMVIEVQEGRATRYVSRGGLKMEGALRHTGLDVTGWRVLDIGVSTGGFADCLLQKGAAQVFGVDVGHSQVSPSLRMEPRFEIFEGINARELSRHSEVIAKFPRDGFDLVVMDVSFISITLIIPELVQFFRNDGYLLSLVKPQFEVGVDGLSKGGIVRDVSLYLNVEDRVKKCCLEQGLVVQDYFPSSIEGKDGNHEFFVFAQRN